MQDTFGVITLALVNGEPKILNLREGETFLGRTKGDLQGFDLSGLNLNSLNFENANFEGANLKGATLYVTKFPCNECAKAIIQSGISEVIFTDDISIETLHNDDEFIATYNMFMNSYVVINEYCDTGKSIVISI